MRILELRAENIKKLIAVDIRPDKALVEISGRNGQGKTSVLDSIWWAIAGTRGIQTAPIRNGAETAMIQLDLGELKITRKFARKEEGDGFTTGLKVEAPDGSPFKSPQAVLDALLGALTFDPLAFTRMKPEDQFDTMRQFVPGVDFDALARADAADFEKRTTVNRQAKELRARADGIALPAGAVPKPIDLAALEKQLGEAATHNADIATRTANRASAVDRVQRLTNEAKRLRDQAADLLEQAAGHEADAKKVQDQIDGAETLPAPIDVADVQAQLTAGREANATATRAAERASLNAQAQALEDESKALTKAMDDREEGKQRAIAEVSMPVQGVTFGAGIVLLNGVPFEQGSDAEQLRASIAIAAAMSPKLRVIRVRDGSLLDDVAMRQLADFAEEQDMQVWIERVGTGGVGFELENGQLKTDVEEAV